MLCKTEMIDTMEFQEKNTTNVYVSSFLQYLYMHASEICVSYNISVYIYIFRMIIRR
jgi:hypothetical protein